MYPQNHDDPKSGKKVKRKKSQKKTERDNQRAAEFQKRKQDELSAAAATEGSPVSAAAASTSTPSKEFEFSEPTCENMSSLESSNNTNILMNLDGNVTLNDKNGVVEMSRSESSDVDTSHEESKGCYARAAACIPPLTVFKDASLNSVPPLNPPPSRVDDSDVEAKQEQRWMEDEDVDETIEEILEQIKLRASLEARQRRLLGQPQESVGAPLIIVERNRKKKKKPCYQQHSRY